jgi:exopolyphosphatase/guanosine-5'-triphosphate,3'-diphosphate pyrophosphatase
MTREAYTLDEFIDELAAPSGAIRPVKVHKRRVRYTVAGCTAEVTELLAEDLPTRTIAIESEDPSAVIAAVRSVGLGGYRNVSYPRGLATVIDAESVRYGVIDVGTNSVKFHVGEHHADGTWRTVVDRAEVTRLGEGLEASGVISEQPLERTAAAIGSMADEARQQGVLAIAAVGTAGLRMAANAGDVLQAIEARTGIRVEVIPGDEESRLAYLAAETGLGLGGGSVVVFDTGGGSSQFTFGHGGEVDERFSVDVGATRFTEVFGLNRSVVSEVVEDALAAIAADLSRLDGRSVPDALVGMGGAITNLTAVRHALATYDPSVVQGSELTRAEVDRQIELYRGLDAQGRRSIVGLQPKRAEVILAGACIVRTVMEKLGQDRLTVSDRGLRHGVLIERFG